MKIAIGSDHAGYKYKEHILKYLDKKKIQYEDFGAFNEESIDYPDVAYQVGKAVAAGKFEKGILICGSGVGMCLVANKVRGVRAAAVYNSYLAKMCREHNDANILCLGAKVTRKSEINKLVNLWLKTKFEEGRHLRRVEKIRIVEKMVLHDAAQGGNFSA